MTRPAVRRGTPWRLALALLVLHLATSPWAFPLVSDGAATLATARALVTTGSLAIAPSFAADSGYVPSAKTGPDGRAYAKYGIGAALSHVPFVLLAEAAVRVLGMPAALATSISLSLLNPLLVALTLLLVHRLAVRAGLDDESARFAMVALGAGSFAWWLAVSDASEPLQALLVTAATAVLLTDGTGRRGRDEWQAGALLGVLVLVRLFLVVLVPVFVSVAAWRAWRARGSLLDATGAIARVTLPVGGAGLLLLALNAARWGHAFETGYTTPMMTSALADGLYGLLLSPTKGLVVYAPFATLALPGLVGLRRSAPTFTMLTAAAAAVLVGATATFFEWGGGWCWGPRYLAPVLPLLVVASAAVRRYRGGRAVAGVLLVAGIAVNALGVVVSEEAYRRTVMHAWHWYLAGTVRAGTASGQVMEIPRRPEDILPAFSSVAGHWWLARVAFEGCDCAEGAVPCACVAGPFALDPVFASPPWHGSYPSVVPAPPWGESLVQPAALRWMYRRAVIDPGAPPPR